MSFRVAIIGRPNVGKSTLFNRLVGRKIAIVHDTPGVTRDRREHSARLFDLSFQVIDTAGLEVGDEASLPGRMRLQTQLAVAEADILLFVFDVRTGITAADEEFAALLRASDKPLILVGNKSESRVAADHLYEGWSLGLGDPVLISAEHGLGMAELYDALVEKATPFIEASVEPKTELGAASGLDSVASEDKSGLGLGAEEGIMSDSLEATAVVKGPLRIAIVGRPNVGKSTLINSMIGEQRLLTGDEAGLTRDSIEVCWEWRGRDLKLFDTAGLRRRARVSESLERLAVSETLRAIKFAEVVVVVLDAQCAFEKQDLQIIDLVIREGRALVIALNKWDLVRDRQATLAAFQEQVTRLLPQVRGVNLVPIAGVQARGLDQLMESIFKANQVWNKRVSTGKLNRWLDSVISHQPPPAVAGRRLKLKYITQVKARPPSFVLSCSRPEAMPQSYIRYLINGLRSTFDMYGVPIRIMLRAPENPYDPQGSKGAG